MKILEMGHPQKDWARECTCTGAGNGDGGCGAKLLVEAGDLYRTASHCRDETDYYTTFMCVSCGVETDVGKVPSHVESKLATPSRAEVARRKREILSRK